MHFGHQSGNYLSTNTESTEQLNWRLSLELNQKMMNADLRNTLGFESGILMATVLRTVESNLALAADS
jgi:hypothetical protein